MLIKISCVFLMYASFSYGTPNLEFGHFDLHIKTFEACRGPKRKDCVVPIIKCSDERCLDVTLNIKENVKITKGKIVVTTRGKETMRLQLKNPCEHLFLKPLLESMLNVTNDCLVSKGYYHFKADLEDIAKKYYKGEFLFGSWSFKSVFYNDECNFSCAITDVEFVPGKKTK